jgi:putative transposase
MPAFLTTPVQTIQGSSMPTTKHQNHSAETELEPSHLFHIYEPGLVYMLTSNTIHQGPTFAKPEYAQIAFDDIAFYNAKFNAHTYAYVVMPTHIHWLVCPSPEDFERFRNHQINNAGKYASDPAGYYLIKIMEDYKRHVAYAINTLRKARGTQIWQQGFFDVAIRTQDAVKKAARYVVFNPVKAGLTENPEDYPFVVGEAINWDFI